MHEEKIQELENQIEDYKSGIKNHEELMKASAWMAGHTGIVASGLSALNASVPSDGYTQRNSKEVIEGYKKEIEKRENQIADLRQ